ncbi:restriction endonuclease subunit S [uncultured Shewanella sp.]|uniref:restriction endonuclease subunit S n=1 Tax=uncultured Shewanella sp. TaxID=173975 RepID=UPI00261A3D08|nr:restriction endonuclease subunit S [uncultured Shewanella sp.]
MSALKKVIPEEYKQTEVGVIPKDWSVIAVKSICKEIFLGLTSKVDYVEYGGIPLIRATDIAAGNLSFDKVRTISLKQHEKLTQYRRAKKGDVLVSKSGSLGVCALVDVDREFSIYESIIVLQPTAKLDSIYLLSLLRSEETQFRMIGEKVGSSVAHLNIEMFRKLSIPLPSCKQEQVKIGQVINDADALLTALEKLIAKKQAIKTATMQQLLTGKTRLPQFAFYSNESAKVATGTEDTLKGKSQGQAKYSSATNVNVEAYDDGSLAFQASGGMDSLPVGKSKGTKPSELGEIPEDWEVSSLGELVTIASGDSPSRFEFISDGIPYFKVEQLNNGRVYADETEYKIITNKVISAGSIIFPKRGASILLNKIRVLKNNSFMDTNLMTLTCNNLLDNMYLYNVLIYQGLDNVADTTSIPQINNKHIIPFLIPLPPKKEQTAIATILSNMDNEIQTLEQRLAKTRQIKQGMMQELLTGRTRLPFDSTFDAVTEENKEVANAN